jgi:hypothetical protein
VERDTVAEALQSLGFIYRGAVEEDDGLNLMFGWKARDAYAALKADLSRRFPNDRTAYIAGKDAFVEHILAGHTSVTE